MACIVLVLSCVPCMDDAFAAGNQKIKTEIAKHPSDQDSDHDDACSPFCYCSCCAGFSMNHSVASVTSLPIVCCNNFSSYLLDNLIEISLPIWQPPKI
jgi:hypothetical protein